MRRTYLVTRAGLTWSATGCNRHPTTRWWWSTCSPRPAAGRAEQGIVFEQADIARGRAHGAGHGEHQVEVVVNLAAESHNSLAALRFFRTNAGHRRLVGGGRAGVECLHRVSTCEVYGDLALDTDTVFAEDCHSSVERRPSGRSSPIEPVRAI
ncbi:MAG: hypothetical protein ACRDVM_05855 [Acidimicrobiia bacterium]